MVIRRMPLSDSIKAGTRLLAMAIHYSLAARRNLKWNLDRWIWSTAETLLVCKNVLFPNLRLWWMILPWLGFISWTVLVATTRFLVWATCPCSEGKKDIQVSYFRTIIGLCMLIGNNVQDQDPVIHWVGLTCGQGGVPGWSKWGVIILFLITKCIWSGWLAVFKIQTRTHCPTPDKTELSPSWVGRLWVCGAAQVAS